MSMTKLAASNSFHRLQPRPRLGSLAGAVNYSLRWSLASRGSQSARLTRKVRSELHSVMDSNILSGAPEPPSSHFPMWVGWILGSLFALILPVWKLKGGSLLRIGQKVEEVVDVVEDVVDAVEDVTEVVDDVADAIEKVSSDLADDLPSDSKLRDVATWVENAAKEVSDGAERTLDFINKVEDLKEELEKKVDKAVDSITGEDESNKKTAVGVKEKEEAQPPQKEEHTKEEASTP